MNTNSLTIDNMLFTVTDVAAHPASKPNTFTNAMQYSHAVDDTPPPSKAPESTTTDNTSSFAQNEPINKPKQDFSHTLRNKTAVTEATQQDQDNTRPKEQDSASHTAFQPDIVQSWLAQYRQTVQNGKEGLPTITNIQPKAGFELAQLLTNLKDDKSLPVTGKAAKSADIKILLTTDKGQPDPKTVLSNIPEGIADTQPGKGKNNDKIPISDSTIATTKTLTNGKKPGTDTLVNDDSKTTNKETTTTDKSAIPGNPKTTSLNSNFPPVQTKLTELQSQPDGTTPGKNVPIAEKPSDSKAATAETFSESSSGSGKESPRAGNKLSDNPTVQELNVINVQVSTGQTKNRGSSTSNDSPDSDLKQILSHNNSQTPVTEQSHNSVEGAKTAALPGQTSPGSVSADIGKQILESMHRSLSHEGNDQQITIRLNPPELGKVFIKFDEQDSQIIGLLEVSKPQTRIEIQQALPQIIQNLQGSGIHIKRLEVVLSEGEQTGQESLKDQSLQNGWTQQQDSTSSYLGGNNPDTNGINEWLINNNTYENISELQGTLITDGINMLA